MDKFVSDELLVALSRRAQDLLNAASQRDIKIAVADIVGVVSEYGLDIDESGELTADNPAAFA